MPFVTNRGGPVTSILMSSDQYSGESSGNHSRSRGTSMRGARRGATSLPTEPSRDDVVVSAHPKNGALRP